MACSRAAGSSGLLSGGLLTVILVSGCGQKSPSEKLADVTEPITSPGWIRFKPEANIDARNFLVGYAEALHLPEGTTMRSVSEETDDLGLAHIRHQQYFAASKSREPSFWFMPGMTRTLREWSAGDRLRAQDGRRKDRRNSSSRNSATPHGRQRIYDGDRRRRVEGRAFKPFTTRGVAVHARRLR